MRDIDTPTIEPLLLSLLQQRDGRRGCMSDPVNEGRVSGLPDILLPLLLQYVVLRQSRQVRGEGGEELHGPRVEESVSDATAVILEDARTHAAVRTGRQQ
eukprot:GHVU01072177.1.p3 GENE.GHVU01072177.1~~GHVU01072177.1.p3  ORF type:complete len:100 (+),score=18.76 GHVU01072177.1:146-445(+)